MNRAGAATRAAAARVVDAVVRRGQTLDTALDSLGSVGVDARDRAQVKALSYGSLREFCRHRHIINELLDRPLRSRDAVVESLLSVGILQLTQKREPGYAAVSATVDAVRILRRPRMTGLVNAALRKFQRDGEEITSRVAEHEDAVFAHPQWIIDATRDAWPDHWQQMLMAANEPPPLWLRVNRARGSVEDYRDRLRHELGIETHRLPGFDDAIRLDRAVPVRELPGFDDGLVSVQDAAAQLAAALLAPQPGMRVLDACAAPGGKSLHLLEMVDGDIDLVALDIDAVRLRLLDDNLQRIGYRARVCVGDVLRDDCPGLDGQFDRILLDAPCSGSGVIRRHPDIRFTRRATDVANLARRQRALLDRLWSLLKPGGYLLYATCSVFPEENAALADDFVGRRADATPLRPLTGEVAASAVPVGAAGYQLLPEPAGTDGFYYALMRQSA